MELEIGGIQNQKKNSQKTRVKVAIRVRPFIQKEKSEDSCVEIRSEGQIIIGKLKSYKFDHVFKDNTPQHIIYDHCIKQLVMNCFEGYNAAVLAYGQTGSGKTHTMGTASIDFTDKSSIGIIPRTIYDIFQEIQQRKVQSGIEIKASFIQIYNEQIIDLLVDTHIKNPNPISIRQQKDGSISIFGATEETVSTSEQMFKLLQNGGKNRTTASTLMNDASSRSHAIFTIFIKQIVYSENNQTNGKTKTAQQGSINAKFFFVDLAGSQRAKKTGATGSALKQGININLGLLELGNVISALSTIQKNKQQFITFRNSKLTRILQDCLGGNSNTYMIACVSPAESNYEQSLNTLKYASKAMNIKNSPVVNRDQKTLLRLKINDLQLQNRRLRLMLSEKGVRIEQLGQITSSMPINTDESKRYKDQAKILNKKLYDVSKELQIKSHKLNEIQIQLLKTRRQKDIIQLNLDQILKQNPKLLQNEQISNLKSKFIETSNQKVSVLEKYMKKIQLLEKRLSQREALYDQVQIQYSKLLDSSKKDEKILIKKNNMIHDLTRQTLKLKKQISQLTNAGKDNNQSMASEKDVEITNSMAKVSHEDQQNNGQDFEMAVLENSELIEDDEFIKEQEEKMLKLAQEAEKDIQMTEKDILQRQLHLQKLYADQRQNQQKLINTMKNDYDKKIINLEKEIKALMKQKDQGNLQEKNKVSLKKQNLQNQLKQLRKKQKEQKMMQKMVQNQKQKINKMTQSIKQMKNQRQLIKKKYEDDKKLLKKYKQDRIKQIMKQKQKYSAKVKQMKKLENKNFRNKLENRKKDQQIKRIKRINQAMKKISKNNPSKLRNKGGVVTGGLSNPNNPNNPNNSFKAQNHSVQISNSFSLDYNQQQIIIEQQKTLQFILRQLSAQIDRQNRLSSLSDRLSVIEQEHQLLVNDQSSLKLRLQRLKLKQQEELLQESQIMQKESLLVDHNDMIQRVKTAQESLNYHQLLYENIMKQGTFIEYFNIQEQILYNKTYDNLQTLKIFVKVIFQIIKNILFENMMINSEKQRLINENNHLKASINDIRQQFINLNAEYCRLLSQNRQDLILNRYDSQEIQQPLNQFRRGKQERQKKQLQKKIQDLSRVNRQLTNQLEKARRKCQVVQQKYQSIKNLISKDKNIGLQEPSFQKTNKMSLNQKQQTNKSIMEELQGLMEASSGVQKLKKVKSFSNLEDYSSYEREAMKEEKYTQRQNNNNWECLAKIDAHNSGVLSLALHQSMLISTATKSIKIWDLQTKKMMTQISGLLGPVKYVMFDPVRRLFFTACQKLVTIWDPVTLRNEATLKCHKDEVRAIHCTGDYLFTGGKGTSNGGSLLIWDLRKINPNHATQQKQKNQDIFALTSKQNVLYYGTRNHSVRRMNINNYDILAPFEPPHLDSVTGLAIVKNKLISGSKDKHVKLWSLDHSINNSKQTLLLFNDYVNCLHSPTNHGIFYAGSKDGHLKVCYPKNDKIDIVTGMLAHSQSVNCISSFTENPYALVTASQDKTIKIWQPSKQTIENIGNQIN